MQTRPHAFIQGDHQYLSLLQLSAQFSACGFLLHGHMRVTPSTGSTSTSQKGRSKKTQIFQVCSFFHKENTFPEPSPVAFCLHFIGQNQITRPPLVAKDPGNFVFLTGHSKDLTQLGFCYKGKRREWTSGKRTDRLISSDPQSKLQVFRVERRKNSSIQNL